jgi:hypothetical protein
MRKNRSLLRLPRYPFFVRKKDLVDRKKNRMGSLSRIVRRSSPKNLDRRVQFIYEEKERRDDDAAPAGRAPEPVRAMGASHFRISAPSEAAGFLVGLPHLSSI